MDPSVQKGLQELYGCLECTFVVTQLIGEAREGKPVARKNVPEGAACSYRLLNTSFPGQ